MGFNLHVPCKCAIPIFKSKSQSISLNYAKISQNMSAQVHYVQNLFKSFKNFFLTHSLLLNGEVCILKCPDSLD